MNASSAAASLTSSRATSACLGWSLASCFFGAEKSIGVEPGEEPSAVAAARRHHTQFRMAIAVWAIRAACRGAAEGDEFAIWREGRFVFEGVRLGGADQGLRSTPSA